MLNISPKLLCYFKGFCSSPSVIMLFVYMKCRFSLSYRELEEMMMIRGAEVDHSTLQRWLNAFLPLLTNVFANERSQWMIAGEWTRPILS